MADGFIWYELMTEDVEAAKAFYGTVVGWEMRGFEGSQDYSVLEANGRGIGGIMATPADAKAAGARPIWFGYIGTSDIEKAVEGIRAAGGNVHRDVMDIKGVGRIAMATDPQGAAFMLIQPDGEDQPPPEPMSPCSIGWHEFHTSDWEKGFDFYSRQFGWEKDEALNMGPMETYQLFRTGGSNAVGGMFNAETFGRPAWLYYFVVANIDDAADRVRGADGAVLNGPTEVPGGAWIIQCRDPQGAMFALVGMRR
jgi:predicted enzyme related to lactoylglutathione lyase